MQSRGLVFHATLFRAKHAQDTIQLLHQSDHTIAATAPRAEQLQSSVQSPEVRVAVVVGNETGGVREELPAAVDRLIRIPMNRELELPNVGVAAHVSLCEMKVKVLMSMFAERI